MEVSYFDAQQQREDKIRCRVYRNTGSPAQPHLETVISPAAGSQFGRTQAELTVIRKQLPAFGGTCLNLEATRAKSRLGC